MSPVTNTKIGRQRPPSLLACTNCRGKHLKCDAQTPICGRCDTRKLSCVYIESKRGYRHEGTKKTGNVVDVSNAGSEECDDAAELLGTSTSNVLNLTTYTWPGALQDPSNMGTPETTSPAESISQNAYLAEQGKRREDVYESTNLIDVFYSSFFPAHGFTVPRNLLLQCPTIIPEELKAVFRYVGSHYRHREVREALRRAAFEIVDNTAPINAGFKVQGLLCLAIVSMAGRLERDLGIRLLHEAATLALEIGLHRKDYTAKRPKDHPILVESWRRTYWDLYVVDTLLSALDGSSYTSKLQTVAADVPLPGHDDDYIKGRIQPMTTSMQEMTDRIFTETALSYSSGAYKVEATRIMGKVLSLEAADSFNISDAQIETIDASIHAFLLSLPPHLREIVAVGDKVDEVLFAAHMIIHWASIILHRPRSNLTFVRKLYSTACSTKESVCGSVLSFQYHTARVIRAADAISKLTSIQTPPELHTPCFACAIALSATVHLPAYTFQDNKSEIRERLNLSVSTLAAIGEVWPLARIVRAQVAKFARETFQAAPCLEAMAIAPRPQELDVENLFDEDSWLVELDKFVNVPVSWETVQIGRS